jgi:hypothetical protein
MDTLKSLFQSHDGKVSDKWDCYLARYEEKFAPYRDRSVSLLEIGIQNGGSLEVWSKYFLDARALIGCDINSKCGLLTFDSPRINVVIGDVNEASVRQEILGRCSSFDIIIDDGSHQSRDIVRTFGHLFPRLNDGGLYVIEDLHCSYWQEFGGGVSFPGSAVNFLKKLADLVNFEHWGIEAARESILTLFAGAYGVNFSHSHLEHVHSVEFSNSLCVIRKEVPEKNAIGHEWLVGNTALVEPAVHPLSGRQRHMAVPSQAGNPWSARTFTPEELALLEKL